MKKLTSFLLIFFVFGLVFQFSYAEEGMFLLNHIPPKIKGLKLKPEQIYQPNGAGISNAVVQVGGGTGSFVSPKGLILTNHHVAYSALQKNSTPESNYIEAGFYASKLQEEIPAPGYKAYITLNFEDITAEVLAAVKENMSYQERAKAIKQKIAAIEKDNHKPDLGQEGSVAVMLDGTAYYLFTYFKIEDK